MKENHHWFDSILAAMAWMVAHFDAPFIIQALTIAVLVTRLALGIREWLKGRHESS